MLTETLGRFFDQAGAEWVLWLLVALSVLSLAVMIERWAFLRKNRVDPAALRGALLRALETGGPQEAARSMMATPGMVGAVIRAALEASRLGTEAVEEMVRSTLVSQRVIYDRYLSVLGTIAANAPFIGLLGTVIGVLNAFGELAGALQGETRTELVMSSISEALVATALGLAVAIPAVVAFNVFKRNNRKEAAQAEAAAHLVLAHMRGAAQAEGPDGSAPAEAD